MLRMDSNAQLSQTSSFQNIHEVNKDLAKTKAMAAGATTQFIKVEERDAESDDESVVHRINGSESASAMMREEESDATSFRRGEIDDATS
jgi:hypothetical protein